MLAAIRSAAGVVTETVCLRDIPVLADTGPAAVIYLARASRPGPATLIWHDGIEIGRDDPARHWLTARTIDYHKRMQPHVTADYSVARVED
jgi:hypothetical protein